jgi:phosphoglycerol transferase MdoB-like AlkP superfamily enzyme
LFDAHSPYEPPPPFKERLPADPYGGEIAYLDEALDRFLDRLREEGLLTRTVVSKKTGCIALPLSRSDQRRPPGS